MFSFAWFFALSLILMAMVWAPSTVIPLVSQVTDAVFVEPELLGISAPLTVTFHSSILSSIKSATMLIMSRTNIPAMGLKFLNFGAVTSTVTGISGTTLKVSLVELV